MFLHNHFEKLKDKALENKFLLLFCSELCLLLVIYNKMFCLAKIIEQYLI